MSILVVAQIREGELRPSIFPIATAAKALGEAMGSGFDIVVMGRSASASTDTLKALGAGAVLVSEADALADYTAEAYADAVVGLVKEKGYKAVIAPATTMGKDLMPRVAALLDAPMVSDVTGCEAGGEGIVYHRPMYAGNAIAKVAVDGEPVVLTIRETAFDAAAPGAGASEVSEFTPAIGETKSRFVELKIHKSARPDLNEADVIVSAGRGVKDAEGVQLVEALADVLGAAVGASRAVVDENLLMNDLQVGQTGKIVAPNLYIACGISGAIQHVAGMKDSKVIVAINKDEEAPIFEVADYGLVADLRTALPELTEKLKG